MVLTLTPTISDITEFIDLISVIFTMQVNDQAVESVCTGNCYTHEYTVLWSDHQFDQDWDQ